MVQSHFFDELPLQSRQALQRIFDGTDLPPLYSDTIAKQVFNADVHPDRLQKWLAMIADVNDPVIAETAADDETLTRIRTEIRSMAQDKEVQNMLTQEMFERMDWASYGEEREEEGMQKGIEEGMQKGIEEGENKLADLLKKLTPGSADFDKALNATTAERKELYRKYGIADN